MDTIALLDRLIAFPTISHLSNRPLIDFCADLLRAAGADVRIIEDSTGQKANLYATIGPRDRPGVLLSGHTDVVPTEGQNWTVPPFELTERDGRLYGRGTTDMKGFVAAALALALRAARLPLQTPLHLALSHDEEVGCVGVRSLIAMLAEAEIRPRLCLVGEPTLMALATGHKGKTFLKATCTGREAHSSLAPEALNAVHLACDTVRLIRDLQNEVIASGVTDPAYDVPYTTLHVGQLSGGVALNIVPNHAEIIFEIRNLMGDDPAAMLDTLRTRLAAHLAPLRNDFPEAAVDIVETGGYPALDTPQDADVVGFAKALTGANATLKVAYGTEAGLFSEHLALPTVVCGPGSIAQAHKPDEYVTRDQLAHCDAMLDGLLVRLQSGL
ncbi:MAG: acetylornithine deacetylase [Pseudomonadota bacterium]